MVFAPHGSLIFHRSTGILINRRLCIRHLVVYSSTKTSSVDLILINGEVEHEGMLYKLERDALSSAYIPHKRYFVLRADGLEYFRLVVKNTLAPHVTMAQSILDRIPMHQRRLDAWAEPEMAALGLHSPERQALVFQHTYQTVLAPRLERLGLL